MKTLRPILFALLFSLLAVAATPGCENLQQNDRQTYAAVNDSFIAAVQVLNEARVSGEFNDEEWNDDILPLIELGNDLLNDYNDATKNDVPAEPILVQISTVLDRLQPYVEQTTD